MNMIRYAQWIGWRALTQVSRHANASSSSSSAFRVNASPSSETHDTNVEETPPTIRLVDETKSEPGVEVPVNPKHKLGLKTRPSVKTMSSQLKVMVNDALTNVGKENKRLPFIPIVHRIKAADSVDALLNIALTKNISTKHHLTIVSILDDWTNSQRIKLSDFESDPRFIKICKMLGGRAAISQSQTAPQLPPGHGDLEMVLDVADVDEAAELVSRISVNQMIKVMSSLASSGRRSMPLLRSLANNLSSNDQVLDMKQGADVLYSMSVLNFLDDALLRQTCHNLCRCIPHNKKSSVIGSIARSLGHLRYKNAEILDHLSKWLVNNLSSCRPQDVLAVVKTLASLYHIPSNASKLFSIVGREYKATDMSTPSAWLDFVWALIVLNEATSTHMESILNPEFPNKLRNRSYTDDDPQEISFFSKRQLLNVNAAAGLLIPNYKGPFLEEESPAFEIPMKRSLEKQKFVLALLESLSNLLPSSTYLNTNVDTRMGFLLDGECIIDNKLNPLPLLDPTSAEKGKRIAIMAWSYDDMCRGSDPTPCGHAILAMRLLQAKGYGVLSVPFTEFNPRDKVIQRVQYLEQKLKTLAKNIKV